MKKHAQLLVVLAYCFAAVSIFVIPLPAQAMGLIWTVVTSEDDAGPGTLRDAINTVNNVGTGTEISPNAIAFANNVRTIKLQSLLPTITAPVLIDGLALVMNGTVVQEGDCSALPTPAEDPCAFSCALRVTIDGSTIPLAVSPDARQGLDIDSENVTIRGLRIINITTSDPDSVAIGVAFAPAANNIIECCEINNIHNTAGTTTSPFFNLAAGITTGTSDFDPSLEINKSYIHNIQGGSITFDCDLIGTDVEQLVSGSAFGTLGKVQVTDSRIEQVQSGSIVACQPSAFGSEGIALIVGTAVGIKSKPEGFDQELFKQKTTNCPAPASCSEHTTCSGAGAPFSVERSVITSIIGGSIISNITNAFIFQDVVAGIFLGTPFNLFDFPSLFSENTIAIIHTGEAAISGNNSEYIRIGSMGILIYGFFSHCKCNTITGIQLATLRAGGSHTQARVGYASGIMGDVEDPIVECNTISQVSGGLAIAEGDCSILLHPEHLPINNNAHTFGKPTHQKQTKNIPTGTTCIPPLPVPVSGINIFISFKISLAKNVVHSIFGGKQVTQGSGSQAVTLGSMGITTGSNILFLPTPFALVDTNSVHSIFGPTLVAQAGGSKIQNKQGTVGISINSINAEITNNCVQEVSEGKVQASQNSIVFHFTNFETSTLLQNSKSLSSTYKNNAIQNPNAVFVPVVTAGISVGSINIPFATFMRVQDNTITGISGATIPTNNKLSLGSIAVGIFVQPGGIGSYYETLSNMLKPTTKDSYLQEICAYEKLENFTLGTINTNSIQSIAGGTKAPAYGIFLDGSQSFLSFDNDGFPRPFADFTITNNTIKTIKGNGRVQPFALTNEQLSTVQSCCIDILGTGTECDLARNYIPFIPFEPTSGIYTLFGGCSQISSNTTTKISDTQTDARGITTAASSDMDIFDNILSQIKGYGIFVGGSFVDKTLPVTGTDFIIEEVVPSLRNKIYNNSTFSNTNKGIELGLIDWSYFIFARDILNTCKNIPVRVHQEPEDALVTYGNHGQVAPCIKKVTCNSSGRITIDATLTGTLLLTDFIIQFFRNSTNGIPHGEQHISLFDDPEFVLHTDHNGNAHGRFTFLPLVPVEKGDTISAHVTVKKGVLSPFGNEFFGDTSEFSTNTVTVCPVSSLMQQPPKPHKPGFAGLLYRTGEKLVS